MQDAEHGVAGPLLVRRHRFYRPSLHCGEEQRLAFVVAQARERVGQIASKTLICLFLRLSVGLRQSSGVTEDNQPGSALLIADPRADRGEKVAGRNITAGPQHRHPGILQNIAGPITVTGHGQSIAESTVDQHSQGFGVGSHAR